MFQRQRFPVFKCSYLYAYAHTIGIQFVLTYALKEK